MFKRSKKRVYYGVKFVEKPLQLLCITTTKEEALEYINKLIYLEHKDDFDSWCFYQNIPDEDKPNHWIEYFETRIPKEIKSQYVYYKMIYTDSETAALIRMFCKCAPIGCSFDMKEEVAYLNAKKSIDEKLKEAFGSIQDILDGDDDSLESEESEPEELVQ